MGGEDEFGVEVAFLAYFHDFTFFYTPLELGREEAFGTHDTADVVEGMELEKTTELQGGGADYIPDWHLDAGKTRRNVGIGFRHQGETIGVFGLAGILGVGNLKKAPIVVTFHLEAFGVMDAVESCGTD